MSNKVIASTFGALWFFLLVGIGSRSALLFLLIFTFKALRELSRNWYKPWSIPLLLGGVYFSVYAFLLTFSATLWARANPHGAGRIVKLVTNSSSPTLWEINTWFETSSTFAISYASSYPIISLSALKPVPLAVLLANANPLPTELLGLTPNANIEFILPWLPKSFLGELLGSVGIFGLFFVVFVMAFLGQYFYSKSISRNDMTLALLVGAILVATFVISFQYPSRVTLRIYSFVYLAPLIYRWWNSLKKKRDQSVLWEPSS
jgi:hypothetical protein